MTFSLDKIKNFFKRKKQFAWPISEHEMKLLEAAVKKNMLPSLNILNAFVKGGNYTIGLEYLNTKTKALEKKEFPLIIFYDERKNGIPFKIELKEYPSVSGVMHKESYGLTRKLRFYNESGIYEIKSNSIIDFKTVFPKLPQTLEGGFLNIRTITNKTYDNNYLRLIIQVKDNDMMYPSAILDCEQNHIKFDNQNWDRQSSLMGLPFVSTKGMFINVRVKNYTFHFYAIEAVNSYFIDSTDKIPFEEFKEITHRIRVAFGFLSGKYYKDTVFYLTSEQPDFNLIDNYAIEVEDPSIITNNQIINSTFFYGHYEKQDEAQKNILKKYHKPFPSAIFSQFCEKLYENPELLRSTEMIINAGSMRSPIQKGALYSVAIETLTEFLKEKNESVFKPISDKSLSKEIREKLLDELGKYSTKVDSRGFEILKKKIENINSPTNADKLSKSFELYKIDLSEKDLEALRHRNDYLHGRKPIESDVILELDQKALHLHSLIGKLILKYVGYEGHYINLPSWNLLHNNNLQLEEIEKIDFQDISQILEKINSKDFSNVEEIEIAKAKLLEFQKLFETAQEIDNLIQII